MHLWIAIVAGLSLGQSQDVEPLPPEDPSVRDPAAAALQDAYEQAADDADGARPPQGYAHTPTDLAQGGYTLTPLLPDGSVPIDSGQVATQQSQTYVPPPVPTVFEAQPSDNASSDQETAPQEAPSGTGGAGAAGTSSTGGGTTAGQPQTGAGAAPTSQPTNTDAPGFGGTEDTGATSTSPASNAPVGGTTGGTPLDSSQVTVQEPTTGSLAAPETATGGSGASGTTGTGTSTHSSLAPATGTSVPDQSGGTPMTAPGPSTTGTSVPDQSGNTSTTAPVESTQAATGTTAPAQSAQAMTGTTAPVQSTQAATGTAAPAQSAQAATSTPAGTAIAANANTAQSNEELTRLRARIAELEQEVQERDAVATERTQAVQSQVDVHEQRAYEAERFRQQRLARIQSAGQWMLAADQALEQGELSVDNALNIADEDFSVVGQTASTDGQGMVVVYTQRARAQIALARDAAGRRDVYAARIALQTAGDELRLMRAATLDRPGSSNALLNR
ncbi:hypothetical protein OV208_27795 [Corallococcus sp. bb12-1]|uniref:hypothetical protein n=1 Tax=Corallococcus sp. bb12-1 TaxID=2996784 RepID=UPI002270552D|nr:hypothetical protein [Corallococcus sp. bb12-1]MCY1045149.1 hypothetical protein [Corallococcus sp. bb12-1]